MRMNILLILVQLVLAGMFLMAGVMKVMMQDKARTMTPALRSYPRGFITFIGVAEFFGALGITLPVWTGILPILTPLAALGLSIIMLGAIYSHLKLKEYPNAGLALLFIVGLVFIALPLL